MRVAEGLNLKPKTSTAGLDQLALGTGERIENNGSFGVSERAIRKAERVMCWRSFWRGFFFRPPQDARCHIAEFWSLAVKYGEHEAACKRTK